MVSLDKAIASGKEHRKPYRGSKVIDKTCRNHGSCDWCRNNRLHKHKRRYKILEEVSPTMEIKVYAKVVCTDNGYESDQETLKKYHKLGDVFEVTKIDMGFCHTYIYEGDVCYNSVHFDFYLDKECTKPYSIYDDPLLNLYI